MKGQMTILLVLLLIVIACSQGVLYEYYLKNDSLVFIYIGATWLCFIGGVVIWKGVK